MAIVKKYKAKIISIVQRSEDTFTLDFYSDTRRFEYFPGQFLHLAIDEYIPGDQWPESRCFSIQSPSAGNIIRITYSIKGRFTKRMASELKEGNNVYLKLPYGNLFLEEHSRANTIFIAGGTGITPFLSLFNNEIFSLYTSPKLFAGFRNTVVNFYDEELESALKINKEFEKFLFYENLHGLIDTDMVLNGNNQKNTFFISGPQPMITYYKTILVENEVPLNRIRTDEWI